jgi:tetratricopeptide (TPR) repeat protein
VGKSRLVREFLAEARDAGPAPMVLRGRSIAFGERIGYHALIDILRAQAELMDTDSAATLRDKLEAWVRAHLPEHVSLLDGLLLTFGGGTTREGDPEQLRRRLLETWKTLLKRLAARRTVIVAFEDLHWADDGVFDLIQAIVEDPESAPVLVICVGRPELLERRPAWGTGWRNALVIDLKPLRPSEADRLVEVLSGPRLTRDVRQVVAQRAGGNPLFAEELVRMLVEGNGDRPAAPEGTIPDTVQAVLTARVDRLPVPERRALQAAAVIGRAFWSGAVAVLAGMSNEEASSAVDGLTARELIIRRPASTIADQGEFAFRHSLARDVAYGLLPRSQRQRAHAQAARWLEAQFGDRTEEAVEVLAEHWRLAGDDARAAEYLLRAANKARRLYANTTALHLYDLALESAERARLQATSAAQVRLGRGEVHQHLGAYAPAMADFEAGLSLAQRAGDRALEATFEHRVGFIHHREARLDPAEAHFARAVALARSAGERLTLGAALIDLATIAWDRGQVDPHRATLTEGIGLLRDAGDRSNLARALNLLCMARYAAGDTTGAIAAAEDAIANAREAGDKSREATSLSYLSVVLGWGGRPREGIRYARAARDLGEAIGDRRRVAYAVIFMVQASYEVGDWGDGIRLQEEHLDLARGLTPAELPFALLTLGQLYYEVGDDARARANLHAGISLATANPAWLKWQHMAAIYLAMVNADRDALQRAADELVRLPGGFVPLDAASVLPCGEALVRLGRHDDLRRLVERDRPMIARYGSAAFLAGLAILDADLAMHAGQPALAARHLDQALAHSKAAENAPLLRLTLERRIRYFNDDTDRGALRVLLERLAGSLPDDLRQTFLASPRVAPFLASEAAHG